MILQRYLCDELAMANPDLQRRVMKNASCLYLEFDFAGKDVVITDLEFMFGGGLEAEHKK
jgi:hypothetical protein